MQQLPNSRIVINRAQELKSIQLNNNITECYRK